VTRLAIIGAGSWGTALAVVLAPRFESVGLWVFEADLAARMVALRENNVFLPGFRIPDNVAVTTSLPEALDGSCLVLSVMPSRHVRRLYEEMRPCLSPGMRFVSATKGIEGGTLLRMTEVIQETLGSGLAPRVAALSGPTFAREIARGDPAAVVIASRDRELAEDVQRTFSGPSLRFYTNDDTTGVELGAALKNVIAIAAGACQGLGLGNNTLAAVITRGLAEITRLSVALGGNPLTLAGLAGLGDLVLTCTGALSRNRQVGIELARGRSLDDIVTSTRMVAEGVETTAAAVALAARHGVEMPITQQVEAMLRQQVPPREALRRLMERSLRGE
jgi:glycerol-3-phosphate dehydrogenase (NAD(P)+)